MRRRPSPLRRVVNEDLVAAGMAVVGEDHNALGENVAGNNGIGITLRATGSSFGNVPMRCALIGSRGFFVPLPSTRGGGVSIHFDAPFSITTSHPTSRTWRR